MIMAAKKATKKVVKKAVKKPKQASALASTRKIKPASVELSSIHGTAGAIIPVPSARLFTKSRRDARIAFSEKNN